MQSPSSPQKPTPLPRSLAPARPNRNHLTTTTQNHVREDSCPFEHITSFINDRGETEGCTPHLPLTRFRHVGQVLYSTECHGFADIREEEKAFGVKMESQSTVHAEPVGAK
jgi:hypothetical protein